LLRTIYVYDGTEAGYRFYGLNYDQGYGTQSNKKIWVMREFVNAETNHLGIALPKGKLRFYRRDTDDQLQFVGENEIDHTPAQRNHPREDREFLRPRRRTQADEFPRGYRRQMD